MKLLVKLLLSILKKHESYIKSKWIHKKINFIGDSITRGTNKVTFVWTVKQKLKLAEACNYGISRGSLAYREELFPGQNFDAKYPPVVSRWKNMDKSDIIFMLIGTNDYSSQVPLGNKDSTNSKEFNGALNIVLDGLKENYRDSTIIVSTLLKRVNKPIDTHPFTIDYYNKAIMGRCKDHNIFCLNLHEFIELDLATDYLEGTKQYTSDGLHPNKKGSKILGRYIAESINNV